MCNKTSQNLLAFWNERLLALQQENKLNRSFSNSKCYKTETIDSSDKDYKKVVRC